MKLHLSVGNDIGNSKEAIVINGKLIQQPSVFAIGGVIPWVDDENEVPKNLKDLFNNMVVSIPATAGIQTGLYHIGKYALKTHGEAVTSLYVKGNNPKSNQQVTYVNTLGTIAASAVEEAYVTMGESPNEINVTADMAAALPVKQHTPSNIKTMQSKFLDSVHSITVHLGLTKKVVVNIQFEYVHVLQEGTPAVFALRYNSKGKHRKSGYFEESGLGMFDEFAATYDLGEIDGSYFEDKNILHFDAGDGTTDSPFTKGNAVDKDYCDGVSNGVGHAIENSINDFLSLVPSAYNSISRQDYSEILKSQTLSRKHKFLPEAQQAFKSHFDNQAKQMLKLANNQIIKIGSDNIDIFAVYGGGSILSKPLIIEELKSLADKVRIQLFYVDAKYAITLNAEGLDWFVRSDIFKYHKKKYLENKAAEIKLNAKKEVAVAKENDPAKS